MTMADVFLETLTDLFLKVLNMSISASWLVLAVLFLRFLLKRAPRGIPVLLWGIVALRLMAPFSIESDFSLVPSVQTVSPEIMMDWTPQIDTGVPVLNAAVNPVITEAFAPDPAASANPLQILIPIASLIWLAGVALLLIYTLGSCWLLGRKVSTAVRLRYNIFQSDYVTTPFVLGIGKPRIYLPFSMSEEDIIYVVAHEKAHIRRHDHWWKPLGFLLLTIHWFNPVMWLAYRLFSRDVELACDESVIETMNNDQRADYAQALLSCSVNRRSGAACPLAFGEVGVKARIRSVMHYRKPAFWISLTALLLCLAAAVCFLTDPKKEDILPVLSSTEAVEELVTETVILEESEANTEDHENVSNLAYFMELAQPDKKFRYMDADKCRQVISEYGDLLDGYILIDRETADGSLFYILGIYTGDPEDSRLCSMATGTFTREDGQSSIQVLYPEAEWEAAKMALAQDEPYENAYYIRSSVIHHSPKTGYLLIHPADSGWGFSEVFNKYLQPNGRAYLLDAAARGIALCAPEGPYLEVYLISETWGEIQEKIPLTEEQAAQILSEKRQKLEEGYGFSARLYPGPNSSLNLEEDGGWFTEFRGVPQTVLDLAAEKCGYQFATPKDIRSDIAEARLDCPWLEEPRYAAQADLPRLQSILTNAEFGYIGACGYGAKLTIRMTDGSELVMYKGTDGCDSLAFGSYGGYFIGDPETLEFWSLFGLDAGTKELLNPENP